MKSRLSRRHFLKVAALGTAVPLARPLAVAGAASAPAADEGRGLTSYQLGPQIWVRYNNRLLTCYRAHRSQKYPYMYPVSGPVSGLSLTDETTLPYPHHRSLFFGCDRVNGGNYWQEGYDTGQILSNGPKVLKESTEEIVIRDTCDWQKPNGPVILKDDRKIAIRTRSEALHIIEWVITLIAVEAITVQKTNHSWFSMRAALDIAPKGGGNLVNAEGLSGEKGTAGVRSAWCDFYGKRAGMQQVTEGIAIFDHPRNVWAPTQWFTRDYGFASPTPLNWIEKPWTMSAGQNMTFRYAVVLHRGTPAEANLKQLYQEWSEKPV